MILDNTEHIIWDWNGTLLDDVEACVEAFNRMLGARKLPPMTRERYLETFDFPVKTYYRQAGFDFEAEDWDAVTVEFHRHYADTVRQAPLRKGVTESLDAARAAGIPMSVLSASETGLLRRMMAARGVLALFLQVRGLGDLYATSKVELGKGLLDAMDVNPEHVLLIGDTTHDYDVSRELGCRCVLVAGGHQAEHRLRRCTPDVMSDFTWMARWPTDI